MSAELSANPVVLDLEAELVRHLTDQESVEFLVRESLAQELIYAPETKAAYHFVLHHFAQSNKAPSAQVLNTEFPDIDLDPPVSRIEWVIEKIRERYQKNKVEELTFSLAKKIEQPKEAMSMLREQVMEIERNSLSSRHIWKPGDHKLFIKNLQEKIVQGGYQGVTIGFKEIDQFTGGCKPGYLTFLLARPKRKKTFFVLTSFLEQARNGNNPVLFTLENTEDEVMLRLSCMLSGVSWDRAQRGQLMPADYKAFDASWEKFNDEAGDYWIEMPPFDERTVPSLMVKADKLGAESIVISQFKYVKGLKDFYRNEHEENAEVAIDLKRAAIRPGLERPILVEAQFNRGGDSMAELEDFDPSKVGLTDMITQVADALYGLFESKDMRLNQQTEFGILEARNHDKAAWYVFSELKSHTEFKIDPGSQH